MLRAGPAFHRVVVGSGQLGHARRLAAGFLGNNIRIPLTGIGVSRDPDQQAPLVLRSAGRGRSAGPGLHGAPEAVHCVRRLWQPKCQLPNAAMVEALQLAARSEGLLLDPVYTGR